MVRSLPMLLHTAWYSSLVNNLLPAEWAIKYVQAEGSRYEKEHSTTTPSTARIAQPPSPSAKYQPTHDHNSYTAHSNKTPGRAIISTSSLRFEAKASQNVHWILPYNRIQRIEKVDRITTKNIPDKLQTRSGQDIRFVDKGGEEYVLKDLERRDEAFSLVVGFSRTTWQVVW